MVYSIVFVSFAICCLNIVQSVKEKKIRSAYSLVFDVDILNHHYFLILVKDETIITSWHLFQIKLSILFYHVSDETFNAFDLVSDETLNTFDSCFR